MRQCTPQSKPVPECGRVARQVRPEREDAHREPAAAAAAGGRASRAAGIRPAAAGTARTPAVRHAARNWPSSGLNRWSIADNCVAHVSSDAQSRAARADRAPPPARSQSRVSARLSILTASRRTARSLSFSRRCCVARLARLARIRSPSSSSAWNTRTSLDFANGCGSSSGEAVAGEGVGLGSGRARIRDRAA